MFKKIIKNQKGSALIFTTVLIVNAVLIVSSIVLIAVLQEKAGGNRKLAPVAYQKADSGIECVLKLINDSSDPASDKIKDELCSNFSNGKCSILGLSGVDAYFFKDDGSILDNDNDVLADIAEMKTIGQASDGSNKVSRSLRIILFVNS